MSAAHTKWRNRRYPHLEKRDEARWLAAGPDMLEPLRNLCADNSVRDGDVPCELYDAARAAIDKATGEQP